MEKSIRGGCFNVLCYIEKVQSDKRIKSLEEGIEELMPFVWEKNMINVQETDFEKIIFKLYKLLEKKGETK